MGIRNFSPQFRNIADYHIDCGIADLKKLRNCHCGPSKFDFRNSATLNLRPVPLLYNPLFSAQDALKINQRQCLQSSVSKEIKSCVKGTVAWDFWPAIFFMNRPIWIPDSYPKFGVLRFEAELENLGKLKSLKLRTWSCRLRKKLRLRNCGVAELRLRKCFLQVAELRLRTQKKVAHAHLW